MRKGNIENDKVNNSYWKTEITNKQTKRTDLIEVHIVQDDHE